MKNEFYTETSHRLLFSCFDSSKQRKTDIFRIHHHAELELGYICEGEGLYILEGESYKAKPGALFLVRPREQHCVPTISTPELISFNIHVTSCYLWDICSEFIEPGRLRAMISGAPVKHMFEGRDDIILKLKSLTRESDANRFIIKRLMLELITSIADDLAPDSSSPSAEDKTAMLHLEDIQNAIAFINDNLTEPLTLDDISRTANLSRSHFTALFRHMTGVTPYEYLLLQRIERAVTLLRESDVTIIGVAQECGFRNLANFNKAFKKVTGMTPSDYRNLKRKDGRDR